MFFNDCDCDLKEMFVLDLSSQQEHEVEEQQQKKFEKSISLPLDNVDTCTMIATIIMNKIGCNLIGIDVIITVLLNLLYQTCIWRCEDGIIIVPELSHMILVIMACERRLTKCGCGVDGDDDGLIPSLSLHGKMSKIDDKESMQLSITIDVNVQLLQLIMMNLFFDNYIDSNAP